MSPEEFRNAFIKSRGLNLTSTPIPVAAPTPVQTVPIVPTPAAPAVDTSEPLRMPAPEAVEAWRRGTPLPPPPAAVVSQDPAVVAAPPARVPSAFPSGGTAPIIATKPVIEQAPGGGISLNSNPVAPGWAGTVGMPASAEEASGFLKGQKYNDLMAGLESMAKGLKPKGDKSDLNTITPMTSQPNTGSANSGELMASILNNRRRKYGISLTG